MITTILTNAQLATTKQANAYLVKNPNQITNSFTITDKNSAATTLNLKATDGDKINQLKSFLKNYDMTSISTNDLAKIGSQLYQNGLIDRDVDAQFISGNMATDANGQQTDKDVKFNAIAMFNEMLSDTQDVAKANPEYGMASQEGYKRALQSLVSTNHVINALSYFANSPNNDLSVKEQA